TQRGPEHLPCPWLPPGHLDGEKLDMSRVVIHQRRRHAQITVERTKPTVVVQRVKQAFSPADRTARRPVAGQRSHMTDHYACPRRHCGVHQGQLRYGHLDKRRLVLLHWYGAHAAPPWIRICDCEAPPHPPDVTSARNRHNR